MSNVYPPAPNGPQAPQQPGYAPPAGYDPAAQFSGGAPKKGGKNVLGLIAMILAILGFVLACIPGVLILGWILLPISFILGIVAVFLKGTKWQAITAIIVSVVGTVVAAVVFFAVIATSFNDAFSSGETTVGESSDSQSSSSADEQADEQADAEVGTRENPAALGSEITSDEWKVTINSVTSGTPAADAVAAANQFNEPADAGTEFIVINYTVTYIGDDADGQMPAFVGVEYVTGAGATVDPTDKFVVAPDAIDSLSTLYNGGTATGNTALQVPSPVDGVLAIRPGMLADTVFVAIQ